MLTRPPLIRCNPRDGLAQGGRLDVAAKVKCQFSRLPINTLPICILICCFGFGCNRSNPYLATQPSGYSAYNGGSTNSLNGALWGNSVSGETAGSGGGGSGGGGGANAQVQSQLTELERRARLLDDNNRQLTAQMADLQQQSDLHRERAELLQSQLADASKQLDQTRMTSRQSQQEVLAAREKVNGMQASMRSRGGATLVANSSLSKTAEALTLGGFPAKVDGQVIRLAVPSDQLFQINTDHLSPTASSQLDRLASSLSQQVPRNRIGVEAHTDAAATTSGAAGSQHQLAASQSVAVLEYLQQHGKFGATQLFALGHGPNHPVADNQSPAGRAQNRRIEFVVYPDSF